MATTTIHSALKGFLFFGLGAFLVGCGQSKTTEKKSPKKAAVQDVSTENDTATVPTSTTDTVVTNDTAPDTSTDTTNTNNGTQSLLSILSLFTGILNNSAGVPGGLNVSSLMSVLSSVPGGMGSINVSQLQSVLQSLPNGGAGLNASGLQSILGQLGQK